MQIVLILPSHSQSSLLHCEQAIKSHEYRINSLIYGQSRKSLRTVTVQAKKLIKGEPPPSIQTIDFVVSKNHQKIYIVQAKLFSNCQIDMTMKSQVEMRTFRSNVNISSS